MAAELGSVASPTQGRRFSRPGRGKNGRNVQLDRLGDVLTAPTYRAQKCFAPSDSLSLPDNVLAPVQKKRRNNKKVPSIGFIFICHAHRPTGNYATASSVAATSPIALTD